PASANDSNARRDATKDRRPTAARRSGRRALRWDRRRVVAGEEPSVGSGSGGAPTRDSFPGRVDVQGRPLEASPPATLAIVARSLTLSHCLGTRSPNSHPLITRKMQCVVFGHAERLIEGIDIAHDLVAPELVRRVRIDREQ